LRIYEINSRIHGKDFRQVTDEELSYLANLGFNSIWMMGVWQISKGARNISKIIAEDFEGSPYAIPNYKINRSLGGKKQFAELVQRARAVNLRVIVDFVSNHLALDSPWIRKNPNFFIRNNTQARPQSTGQFFLHPNGEVVAFGRDPHFPPWHDTSQLDYTDKGLRVRMTKVLKRISQMADGVRCDMAMLILRDYFRKQWYPFASEEWFHTHMPEEFWDQAIRAVKDVNPEFLFIAESYWDKEPELLDLGFDLAYEKKLYDGLVARNAALVTARLLRNRTAMEKSLYFIENHDEERAAAIFDREHNLASVALLLSIPGSTLIHEGQLIGLKERIPVQRLQPLTDEQPDPELKSAYEQLLSITKDKVFLTGEFQLFESDVYGVVSFIRRSPERIVAYLGQIADAWHSFSATPINITPLAKALDAQAEIRITNLSNGHSKLIEPKHGLYHVQLSEFGAPHEVRFCLLEATLI
jgi:glycosidase